MRVSASRATRRPVDSRINCAPSFEDAATMLWTMGHDHWSFGTARSLKTSWYGADMKQVSAQSQAMSLNMNTSRHLDQSCLRQLPLVRQMHGGKNYDLQFGLRMRGQGPFADLTFQKIRTSLPTPRPLGPPQAVTTDLFKLSNGVTRSQLDLFG